MKRLGLAGSSIALVVSAWAAWVAAADAAEAGPICWPVRWEITARFVDCAPCNDATQCPWCTPGQAGCTISPVGLCTEGQVHSPGFTWLNGTTRFVATGVGGGAVGEQSIVTPPAEPSTSWSYSGRLMINTSMGLLRISDLGVLDTVRGIFTELNRVIAGTKFLKGATGNLFVNGTTIPDGSGFEGKYQGKLCVPGT